MPGVLGWAEMRRSVGAACSNLLPPLRCPLPRKTPEGRSMTWGRMEVFGFEAGSTAMALVFKAGEDWLGGGRPGPPLQPAAPAPEGRSGGPDAAGQEQVSSLLLGEGEGDSPHTTHCRAGSSPKPSVPFLVTGRTVPT